MGSIPGRGTKISQASGQLSLRAATTEPRTTTRVCARQRKIPRAALRPDTAKQTHE